MGKLVRKADAYYAQDAEIISDIDTFITDQHGRPWPKIERNGELKQFIKGGSALSIASSNKAGTLDSMIQYFEEDNVEMVSNNDSYEETAIFSPDERLALCMSTRFSHGTNGEIFALCKRPLKAVPAMSLSMVIYSYGVMDVRHFRNGNIGPVLIDVAAQQRDPAYMGVNLQAQDTDRRWVFSSPISWHPDKQHVLWNEVEFATASKGGHGVHRMRIAHLPDYQPSDTIATKPTPKAVYGVASDMELIRSLGKDIDQLEIPGLHSGRIVYTHKGRSWEMAADYSHIKLELNGQSYEAPMQADQSFAFEFAVAGTPVSMSSADAASLQFSFVGAANTNLHLDLFTDGSCALVYEGMGTVTEGSWTMDTSSALPKFTISLADGGDMTVESNNATKFFFDYANVSGSLTETLELTFEALKAGMTA